jgi:hypothetical protein
MGIVLAAIHTNTCADYWIFFYLSIWDWGIGVKNLASDIWSRFLETVLLIFSKFENGCVAGWITENILVELSDKCQSEGGTLTFVNNIVANFKKLCNTSTPENTCLNYYVSCSQSAYLFWRSPSNRCFFRTKSSRIVIKIPVSLWRPRLNSLR